MNPLFSDELGYIVSDAKEYGQTRWELVKLTLLEKLGRLAGLLLFGLTLILLVFALLAGGSIALIYALSTCMPSWGAALIVAGLWGILLAVVIWLRKPLFVYPMLGAVANILFTKKPAHKLTEESIAQETEMIRFRAQEQEKNLRRETMRIEHSWMQLLAQFTSAGNLLRMLFNHFKGA